MIFSKIKHNKGQTELVWSDSRDNGTTFEHTMRSSDEPRKEFVDAMHNLSDYVLKVCEFEPTYREGLTVIGVSFSENDTQGLGITVTALKKLEGRNAPLVINTPFIGQDDEHAGGWPLGTKRMIDTLETEADKFRRGDRAQSSMFTN